MMCPEELGQLDFTANFSASACERRMPAWFNLLVPVTESPRLECVARRFAPGDFSAPGSLMLSVKMPEKTLEVRL